jgi:uncharacterized small protein (DUF1192 family)
MSSDLVIFFAIGAGYLVAAAALLSAVWAVWRMTWAHERIAQHVGEIERLVAEHVRRGAS